MKPGYKTTEFWIALLTGLIATFGTAYGLTAAQQEEVNKQLAGAVTAIGTLATFATVACGYIQHRTSLKMNEQDAEIVKSLDAVEVVDDDEDDDPADAWKKG